MIKILIADDHQLIREGLKKILKEEHDMSVVGEGGNADEVFKLVRESDLDVVLLDISMPGRSGLEVLKELKHTHPKLPVLMLSMHPEDRFAVRSLKAGASGYITKESAGEELVSAIRKVVGGGKYISMFLAEKLAFGLDADSGRPPHEALSDREFQVMTMISSGKKMTEIAEELSLSIRTVNTYRARILEKMQMKSNAELIHYAIQHGLVD